MSPPPPPPHLVVMLCRSLEHPRQAWHQACFQQALSDGLLQGVLTLEGVGQGRKGA